MKKLTITMYDSHGAQYAIDRTYDPVETMLPSEHLITLRVGFDEFTLSRSTLSKMLNAVQMATAAGATYPEDYAGLAGL